MRILFLIRSLDAGGAERQLVNLAGGLKRKGHDVRIAVFYPGGAFEYDAGRSGIRLHSLEKKGRWDMLAFTGRLIRLVHAVRPDILHGYLPAANVLTALCKPLFPNIRVFWGVRAADMDMDKYDWLARCNVSAERLCARMANRIVANSQAGRTFAITKGFPPSRMAVVENGIDTDTFFPDPSAGTNIRLALGIPPDAPVVGLPARIDPMKGHDTFLQAATQILESRPDAHFLCIGAGEANLTAALQKQSVQLGLKKNIVWAGSRNDMPSMYNAMDLACMTSISESFPNVVAEAMSCGVPCAVTNVGDAARIVGDTGLVVPPSAPDYLAKAVLTLLNQDKSDRMARRSNARKRIVEHFSIGVLTEKTETLLEEALR